MLACLCKTCKIRFVWMTGECGPGVLTMLLVSVKHERLAACRPLLW